MIAGIIALGIMCAFYWAILTGGLSNLNKGVKKAVSFKDMTEEEQRQTMEAMRDE